MNYLNVEQVLFLHARVVEETERSQRIRDIGLSESAIAPPQTIFEGQELYVDIFSKAAALMDSLIGNHPFVDGNKRTGVTAAAIFLRRNGWLLFAGNRELEDFTWQVASAELSISQAARWLKRNCTPELS